MALVQLFQLWPLDIKHTAVDMLPESVPIVDQDPVQDTDAVPAMATQALLHTIRVTEDAEVTEAAATDGLPVLLPHSKLALKITTL